MTLSPIAKEKVEKLKRLALGYVRVSTQKQVIEGDGLDAQTTRIKEHAASLGFALIGIAEDLFTGLGADSMLRRPGLQGILKRAKADKLPIFVTAVDRLTRHEATLKRILNVDRVPIISIKEGVLGHTYTGSAGRDAEDRGNQIAASTLKAHKAQKAQGKTLGHLPTLEKGRKTSLRKRREKSGLAEYTIRYFLEEDPTHLKLTRGELADAMNARGLRNSKGLEWSLTNIRRLHVKALDEMAVQREIDLLPYDDLSIAPEPFLFTTQQPTKAKEDVHAPAAVDASAPVEVSKIEIPEHYRNNPRYGSF